MSLPIQPPLPEIDLHWTDEQIISLLEDYLPGSHLPENVLEDSSPFLYPPSSLPEGMWYLVHLNEKRESVHGFWKAKGEACKVYSNTVIDGWRSTLEYFEGLAPDGQITDWVMQEYMIAPKELNGKDKAEDSRLLCRVFLSKTEMNPSTGITSDQDAGKEPQVKRECEEFDEADCISRGDFLELNDLESHSSSSSSYLSEEYFGSSAFLRDIEKNIKEEEEKELLQLLSSPTELAGSSTSRNSSGGGDSSLIVQGNGGGGGGGGGSSRMNKLRTYFCFATF